MHLITKLVALCGFASSIAGFAMPPMLAADVHDSLALAPRIDESYSGSPDPCSLADSPAVNASIQLANWLECQINGFFPYPANGPWDTIYHRTFHPSLHATFNSTHYNYTNFLSLYTSFNATLGQTFAPFRHGFLSSLAVPNANGDRGGFVYVIGWEGGWHVASKRELWFSDAVFAVVRDVGAGERRIVEFRESSNIPNSATLPEGNEGGCGFVE